MRKGIEKKNVSEEKLNVSSNLTYFTIGSTKDEVLRVQGTPSSIMGDVWFYGISHVSFLNGHVDGYSNTGNLKVRVEVKSD